MHIMHDASAVVTHANYLVISPKAIEAGLFPKRAMVLGRRDCHHRSWGANLNDKLGDPGLSLNDAGHGPNPNVRPSHR